MISAKMELKETLPRFLASLQNLASPQTSVGVRLLSRIHCVTTTEPQRTSAGRLCKTVKVYLILGGIFAAYSMKT